MLSVGLGDGTVATIDLETGTPNASIPKTSGFLSSVRYSKETMFASSSDAALNFYRFVSAKDRRKVSRVYPRLEGQGDGMFGSNNERSNLISVERVIKLTQR